MWMESNNKVYGRTNNPYDPSRIVGGSSGGEALRGVGRASVAHLHGAQARPHPSPQPRHAPEAPFGRGHDQTQNGVAIGLMSAWYECLIRMAGPASKVSAMTKDPVTGVVGYNADKCIGCRYCVAACPFGIPKYQYDSPTGRIGKCELCRHRHKDGHYSACAEVCPTGATLFGRTEDLLAEAKRRVAMKPGELNRFPRGRLKSEQERQAAAQGKVAATTPKWRPEPDQSYETPAGKYLPHVYGEKEYGGTQVLKLSGVNFQKVGMPDLPPDAAAALSETIQHTLYGNLIMPFAVLGAMSFIAKRNVKPDDDSNDSEEI